MEMSSFASWLLILGFCSLVGKANAFGPRLPLQIHVPAQQRIDTIDAERRGVLPITTKTTQLNLVKVDGYDEAFAIIDQCSVEGQPSDELFDAVRFLDKNAMKLYPDENHKAELWDTAHGSWKLQLATGGGKKTTFKSIPIFAFAMIDEINFGNGVGINENLIILSLLGPHIFKVPRRQMMITINDLFLFSNKATNIVPNFIKDEMGIGKQPEDFNKPPAFTMIGASDKSLIARGGTGGIAIWTRLDQDIRPAAYGQQ